MNFFESKVLSTFLVSTANLHLYSAVPGPLFVTATAVGMLPWVAFYAAGGGAG